MGLTKKRNYEGYTLAYKIHAVKLSHQKGVMARDVATSLGIHPVMLYRWRQEFKEGRLSENKHMKIKETKTSQAKETKEALKVAEKKIKVLEKELALKDEEVTILKKAKRFFSEQPKKNTHL